MKKTIMIAVLLAATSVFAEMKAIVGTNEYNAIEWANTKTNRSVSFTYTLKDTTAAELNEFDTILAANGNISYDTEVKDSKIFANFKNLFGPKAVAMIDAVANNDVTDNIVIRNMVWEMAIAKARLQYRNTPINDKLKERIAKKSVEFAKVALRKQGKSFVDKDGVSPVKPYVDAVTAGLNAPKYAGLNAALKAIDMDFDVEFTVSDKYSDADIAKLKEAILIGKTTFGVGHQNILKIMLGTEEYNKFVKLYNEGE